MFTGLQKGKFLKMVLKNQFHIMEKQSFWQKNILLKVLKEIILNIV